MLTASVSSDLQSALLTCNASCSSDFILWFVNHTVIDDMQGLNSVYYNKTSKRKLKCFSPESDAESNALYYTEGLRVVPVDNYSATLSCAAIFACTREEINENCMPRMCCSAHEEEISRLLIIDYYISLVLLF